jgi:hypothetical protein
MISRICWGDCIAALRGEQAAGVKLRLLVHNPRSPVVVSSLKLA